MNEPRVIYEDSVLLALYKPSGWHTFSKHPQDRSLGSWLVAQKPELKNVGENQGPALVHRLDAPTSGLMLAGKDESTFWYLRRLFQNGQVEKVYLALVEGLLAEEMTIDLCLGARYRRSRRVSVVGGKRNLRWSKKAITQVVPLASGPRATLCRVRILTGVRHQIRAHLAHVGHPVWGDTLYGAKESLSDGRIMLHALSVTLVHPQEKDKVSLGCRPDDGWVELVAGEGLRVRLFSFLKEEGRNWRNSSR